MATEKGNPVSRGDESSPGGDSSNKASDSVYSLPEEARATLGEWLFAMRLKKYRRMKKLEGGEAFSQMPGVAKTFHSSSLEDGMKVDETADADVVAFEGDAGPEVSFVEPDPTDVRDSEFEDLDGVPTC